MGKIAEIIQSGIAPGFPQKGRLDPQGVQAKALRGLRAVEDEPIFKHGPARGARGIAKYFGMGDAGHIKKEWERPFRPRAKRPLEVATMLLVAFLMLAGVKVAEGQYITPGISLANGQTVYASTLNQLVANATIGSGFISTQPINNSPLGSDFLIEYSPTLNGLYKLNLSYIFSNPQSYTALNSGTPNVNTNDLFQFYSQTAGAIESITPTNLENWIAENLPVALLNFAPTNNGGATNAFALAPWLTAYPFGTNNQAKLLAWGTNGIPYQMPYTTLVAHAQSTIETNSIAWNFEQMFYPWLIYGTNANFPYTNAFGLTTNFPITAYFQTNSAGTNIATLTDTDTIPIAAYQEGGTNTSATLLSVYEYMTNKNALPPYTLAREQFSGYPLELGITNCPLNGYVTTNDFGQGWFSIGVTTNTTINPMVPGNIYAFSLITNGTSMFNTSGEMAATTNICYYGLPFLGSTNLVWATNVMFFNVYTNYGQAYTALTTGGGFPGIGGALEVVGNYGTGNFMLLITNYTSVNGDVTQATTPGAPATIRTGVYNFNFRTTQSTELYYVTGITLGKSAAGHYAGIANILDSLLPTTNVFTFGSYDPGVGYENYPVFQILVQPQ